MNHLVHRINNVRQTEIHTPESLVPEPSAFEFEMAIGKLKGHKSPRSDQIPAELIDFIWNKEEFPEQWKESIIITVYKKGDKTDCSNYRGISLLSTAHKILSNILLSRLTPYAEEITGDHQCGFDTTGQLLSIYSAFIKYSRKNGNKMRLCVSYLYPGLV